MKKSKAAIALDRIRQLYKIEEKIKDLDPEHRLAIRHNESKKLMSELEGLLQVEQYKHLPKSLLGKAINYALMQWPKMKVFLDNSYVRIIGRDNWMCVPLLSDDESLSPFVKYRQH